MFTPREGFVYLAGREGAACLKRIVGYATVEHMRTDLPPKRSAKLVVWNCQSVKGVTIFHVESRDRSARPLTAPLP